LWNQNIKYRVRKSLPLDPILRDMNPVHNFPSYFPKIHFNIVLHLHLGLLQEFWLKYFMRLIPSVLLHTLPISSSFLDDPNIWASLTTTVQILLDYSNTNLVLI
jgi:hypothetical protein